ncbi:hypothetical protein FOA52_013891 [Chlamydomonas sp. UWO 241]|nr:hypothetical protein FOA52_013891 [Chlamydomonas sp. UWO 241]
MSAAMRCTTQASTVSSSRRPAPFSGRRAATVVRAASEPGGGAVVRAPVTIAPLTWDPDTETPEQVMAFGGAAPERANGRAAMLGFAAIAITELSSHTPAAEQLSSSVPSILFVSLLLAVATVMPKVVSGAPLAQLHAAATSENLKAEGAIGIFFSLFDCTLEMWSGRLAMLGLVGLPIVEAFKGDALF